jgi:cytochrome c peroxidase
LRDLLKGALEAAARMERQRRSSEEPVAPRRPSRRVVSLGVLGALLAPLATTACSPSHPPPGAGGGDAGGDADGPAPVFLPAQWAALQSLSPVALPAPPPDVTNRFADDGAAATFGQKLFYDPSFSGPLLDTDNDGGPGALGKAGQTGRVACAGCHLPRSGFSDTRSGQLEISLGAGWGRRRAPSLLDVGQAKLVMWDGKRDTLYDQIFGPLESVAEMNSSRLYMAERIYAAYRPDYEAVFGPMPPLGDAAQFPPLAAALTGCQPTNPAAPPPSCDGTFHGMPGDGAEFDGMTPANQAAVTQVVVDAGKAIGAFERLLTCGVTPFDAWMHGGPPLSHAAQRGALVFVGDGGCVSCHAGPFLSDQAFHNVGLEPEVVQQAFVDADDQGAATGLAYALTNPVNARSAFSDGDDGRLPDAVAPAMSGAFRTPMMRCVGLRPTFMHTGQLHTLADVVAFFDAGGEHTGYPGESELHPLGLTALQRSDLVAFLESLTGPGASPPLTQAPSMP